MDSQDDFVISSTKGKQWNQRISFEYVCLEYSILICVFLSSLGQLVSISLNYQHSKCLPLLASTISSTSSTVPFVENKKPTIETLFEDHKCYPSSSTKENLAASRPIEELPIEEHSLTVVHSTTNNNNKDGHYFPNQPQQQLAKRQRVDHSVTDGPRLNTITLQKEGHSRGSTTLIQKVSTFDSSIVLCCGELFLKMIPSQSIQMERCHLLWARARILIVFILYRYLQLQ